jgi:hypothetical protein
MFGFLALVFLLFPIIGLFALLYADSWFDWILGIIMVEIAPITMAILFVRELIGT